MAEYDLSYYKYWLSNFKGMLSNKKRKLVSFFGDEKALFDAPATRLSSTGLLTLTEIKNLLESKRTFSKETIEKHQSLGISLITEDSPDYPLCLKNIYNRPYGIFCKGSLGQIENGIAIVGARIPTAYGRSAAEEISLALAENGATIISGLARGIDVAGHSGALIKKTKTIAVLGCGVDKCYPRENLQVYEEIPKNGAVISEFPPGTPPLPINFPMRNRIISGLAKAVIVIEAKEKSGSLITADFALEQGRDIFALPGRINDKLSRGTNYLIYQGAGIITSVEELIRTLTETGIITKSVLPKLPPSKNLKTPEDIVLGKIDYTPTGVDDLILSTKLPINELLRALWSLNEKGLIREEAKNVYVKSTL